MRVATYTQASAPTRGSVAALAILVATIVLGTTAGGRLVGYFVPQIGSVVTIGWLGLYVLAFLGLMFGQGINWLSWLVRYRILLVLLLFGSILSIAWSLDPRVSTDRVVHLVGSSLLGIYFGFTVPLLTTLRVLGVVLGAIMLASVAAALALPDLGISAYEGQLVWSGVLASKNHLGFWAAAGVLLYVALSDSTRSTFRRLLCYLMAGLCLALLVFSQSATALLAMLIGGSLSLYLYIANRFRLGFARMAVLAVLFIVLVGFAAANIDTAELIGRSDDLTGRGEVWSQTWKLIMAQPLHGYGYGALWFPTDATLWIQQSLTDFTWVVHHAHNGFLQIASEIGLPLAVVALLMIVQQMVEIVYCQYQRQQAGTLFVLAFVVAYLIGNYSEARFLVTRELYWILFIALPISMLRQINLVAEESPTWEHEDDGRVGAPGEGPPWGPGPAPAGGAWAGRPASGGPRATGAGAFGPGSALAPLAAGAAAGTSGTSRHGPERRRSPRWDDDDGLDGRPTGSTDPGYVAGDAGDRDGAEGDPAPRDVEWSSVDHLDPVADDELPEDRFDKTFDATGDGTGDWGRLPYGSARR